MKYLLIILTLLTVSCETDHERKVRLSNDEVSDFESYTDNTRNYHIHYSKDKRTNLCFAYHELGGNNAVFTNVPCTSEVESILDR